MFEKIKGAAQSAGERVKDAVDVAGDTVQRKAEASTEASLDAALDAMQLAALKALERPAVKDVTVTAEVNLLIGTIAISATFDPSSLQELLDAEKRASSAEVDLAITSENP